MKSTQTDRPGAGNRKYPYMGVNKALKVLFLAPNLGIKPTTGTRPLLLSCLRANMRLLSK